ISPSGPSGPGGPRRPSSPHATNPRATRQEMAGEANLIIFDVLFVRLAARTHASATPRTTSCQSCPIRRSSTTSSRRNSTGLASQDAPGAPGARGAPGRCCARAPSDGRVVAATNADLQRRVQTGEFRRDLLARLAFWELELPALRSRRIDPLELAIHTTMAVG